MAGITTFTQRADAEEVPRQIRDRTKTDELESRQSSQLRQVATRDERGDRRAVTQAEAIGEPVSHAKYQL